jgi:mutator protein MutT
MPGVPDGEDLPLVSVDRRPGEGAAVNIVVVAAVVEEHDAFLVTRRPAGVHLSGFWEFPGGKIDEGESHPAALRREMMEELGTDIEVGLRLLATTHAYADRDIELHFYQCALLGTPRPLLGQEMAWVNRADLRRLAFPDADDALIALLTSPPPR